MPTTYYHTCNGRIIGETTAGVRTDYLTDALGSVTATVNSSQAIVNTYRYKPYGEQLAKTGAGADPRFLWTGDAGSRTTLLTWAEQYNRARHYGSKQGQWTSTDILWPREAERCYAWLNPVLHTDSNGLCPGKVVPIWHDRYCITGVGEFPGYWEYTHPCSHNPCQYALDNNPDTRGKNGFVACCLGKAYACLRPGAFPDASVRYCAAQHEEDHIKRNKDCKFIYNSGCLGFSPSDFELGGGWYDRDNKRDECLAYLKEHSCLDQAAAKYGCSPTDAPGFLGHPNKEKCRAIYRGIDAACADAAPYCQPLGWDSVICKKWGCT